MLESSVYEELGLAFPAPRCRHTAQNHLEVQVSADRITGAVTVTCVQRATENGKGSTVYIQSFHWSACDTNVLKVSSSPTSTDLKRCLTKEFIFPLHPAFSSEINIPPFGEESLKVLAPRLKTCHRGILIPPFWSPKAPCAVTNRNVMVPTNAWPARLRHRAMVSTSSHCSAHAALCKTSPVLEGFCAMPASHLRQLHHWHLPLLLSIFLRLFVSYTFKALWSFEKK